MKNLLSRSELQNKILRPCGFRTELTGLRGGLDMEESATRKFSFDEERRAGTGTGIALC